MKKRNGSIPPQRFPPEVLQRFFAAVEINDVMDPVVGPLPPAIELPCTDAQARQCLALSLQFWDEGVRRRDLARLVDGLMRGRDLNAADRLAFKHIRARFKQLRFAQRLYGKRHQADWLLEVPTVRMGELQDAFRNGARRRTLVVGVLLGVMIARPLWWLMRRRALGTPVDDAAGLAAHRQRLMQKLKKQLGAPDFAGRQFHALRRIVSQQVAYYDMRRSIDPSGDLHAVSRFLAGLNALMGARHDRMVADALAGRCAYDMRAPLDRDIRVRLEALIDRYPLPSLVPSDRTQPLACRDY